MLSVLAPATVRLIVQLAALGREEFLDLLAKGRGRIVTKTASISPVKRDRRSDQSENDPTYVSRGCSSPRVS